MRILVLFLLVGALTAQAPSSFKAKPVGNLKQVMRGILLPNSDLIFAVQQKPPKDDKGWADVANAAVALSESGALIAMPGRVRDNGQPVPVQRPDWNKFVQALVDASKATLKAALSKNADAVGDSTDALSLACDNCHQVYRDKPQK
jgi:cytochrome c556